MKYYFSKVVDLPFGQALEKTREVLRNEGFGIVTEIDMQRAFREKLGKEYRPYHILGACNPEFAFRAIETEDKIGVMLPCNVVVQETVDGRVEVTAVDPISSMMAIEQGELRLVAFEVQQRLQRVIEEV